MHFVFSHEGTPETIEDAFRAQIRRTEHMTARVVAEQAFVYARAGMLDARQQHGQKVFTVRLDLSLDWSPTGARP